ncbi:MAG TPA: hypothetical protein VF049_05070 [Nocardioidaceae bacterium]
MARRGGRQPGKIQRGNEATYDPASGRNYRPTPTFAPLAAVKLIKAAEAMNMSVSGLLNELVRRMDVDEIGRPVWVDELDEDEGRLPLQEAS